MKEKTSVERKTWDSEEDKQRFVVLEETPGNMLIMFPDGTTDNVTLSNRNKLMYKHGMYNVLEAGTEVYQTKDGGHKIQLSKGDSGVMHVSVDGGYSIIIGPEDHNTLVDALAMKVIHDRDGKLLELHDDIADSTVRAPVIDALEETPPFDMSIEAGILESTEEGWLFYDEMLMTWKCKFRMPGKERYDRSGNVLDYGEALSLPELNDGARSVGIDGDKIRMTDREVEFFLRAVWCLKKLA